MILNNIFFTQTFENYGTKRIWEKMIKFLFRCSFLLLDNMLIFETFFFYCVDSRCMKRKKEDEEVERGCRGRGVAGRRQREAGRGILRGWKSIPLDGVTSRAQLAPARVSFRRGFRIYCLSLTGVFCQRFRFFHVDSYIHISIYIACMMRRLHLSRWVAAPVGSPSSRASLPARIFFLFYSACSTSADPPSPRYPIS